MPAETRLCCITNFVDACADMPSFDIVDPVCGAIGVESIELYWDRKLVIFCTHASGDAAISPEEFFQDRKTLDEAARFPVLALVEREGEPVPVVDVTYSPDRKLLLLLLV